MPCIQESELNEILAGQVSSDAMTSIEGHLSECTTCTQMLEGASRLSASDARRRPGGAGRTADPSFAARTQIGRYLLLDVVGRGGMGEVYSAYDPALDRRIALKVLHWDTQGNQRLAQRLLREAKAIARLRHTNVVAVYDAGTIEGRVFVAMEFLDGQTVADWMRAAPARATWHRVLEVFQAAGRGLAAAHDGGIIHRDFKPQNLMIDKDGGVRVMDFGLARWSAEDDSEEPSPLPAPGSADSAVPAADATPEARLTRTGALMGTPAYMSPEQISGGAVDARSDQFSFCVSLYEALYRERPFPGNNPTAILRSMQSGQVREPLSRRAVPPWLRRAVLRGLSRRPEDRWPSMHELLRVIEGHSGPRTRHRVASLATGALILVALAAVVAARRTVASAPALCRDGAARLEGVWEAESPGGAAHGRREAVRAACVASDGPAGASAFTRIAHMLDQYTAAWMRQYGDACAATHIHKVQSAQVLDLRMDCLNRRRDDIEALTRVLAQPAMYPARVGTRAVADLGSLERCQDVSLLREMILEPSDPAIRPRVDDLRHQLAARRAAAHAEINNDAAYRALGELVKEADRLGYPPLIAEAYSALGWRQEKRLDYAASMRSYERGFKMAFASHDDEVAAEAAVQLVGVSTTIGNGSASAAWEAIAVPLLDRLGGHPLLRSWLAQNRASVADNLGRYRDAVTAATEALRQKREVLPPDHPDLFGSLTALAIYNHELGEQETALRYVRDASELAARSIDPHDSELVVLWYARGLIFLATSHPAEAREQFQLMWARMRETLPPDAPMLIHPLTGLGRVALAEGHPDQARPLLERAIVHCDRPGNLDPPTCATARLELGRILWRSGKERARASALIASARTAFAAIPDLAAKVEAIDQWRRTAHAER